MKIPQRATGSLLGLACGDAVGTTVEFYSRERFKPMTDMVGGGKFQLERGQWTDDTSMAICLAESLISCNDFDPIDQLTRYYEWATTGHNSSTGKPFGLGKHTLVSLGYFKKTGEPYNNRTEPRYSGNGSLMRLCPVILFYLNNPEKAVEYAGLSSKTTHASNECIQSCEYFATLLLRVFSGVEKDQLFHNDDSKKFPLLKSICLSEFKHKESDEIKGTGYVIESLEAALWAFWHTENFKEAILKAANLGDDADTTAAICGQIAGAYYGVENIPENWLSYLYRKNDIEQLALDLVKNVK